MSLCQLESVCHCHHQRHKSWKDEEDEDARIRKRDVLELILELAKDVDERAAEVYVRTGSRLQLVA